MRLVHGPTTSSLIEFLRSVDISKQTIYKRPDEERGVLHVPDRATILADRQRRRG
ncbi:MAG: hypothetical protein HYY04_01540 [Chloroflexi bacterium]|nr:hypothetical protein [Chloroflexota bacterium]